MKSQELSITRHSSKLGKTVERLLHWSVNAEIACLSEALNVSEQKFADMFQLSPMPICFLRLDGQTIELMNKKFTELIGATGSTIAVTEFIRPEELERLFEKFENFKRGNVKEESLDTEFIHQQTGKPIPISMFASRFFIGEKEAIVVGAMDMTERKKLLDTDALTGVYNRRGLIEHLEKEMKRARRYGHPLSVAMIDIDRFKEVNDKCGHAAGDIVLRTLAQTFQHSIREMDFIGRMGGDEFVVVLPETGEEGTYSAMRQTEIAIQCPSQKEGGITVTVSIGIATVVEDGEIYSLLDRADKALYVAKDAGGDKIVRFSELNTI